jgi:hypothetical protein
MRIKPNNFAIFLMYPYTTCSKSYLVLHNHTNALPLSSFLGFTSKSDINRLFSTSLKERIQNEDLKLPVQPSEEDKGFNVLNNRKLIGNRLYNYIVGDYRSLRDRYTNEALYRNKYKKKDGKGNDGIYVVIFRVLNNEKRDIIYKAIYYDELFVNPLLFYFLYNTILINKLSLLEREFGSFESIIDSELFKTDPLSKFADHDEIKDKDTLPRFSNISVLMDNYAFNIEDPSNRKLFIKENKNKD